MRNVFVSPYALGATQLFASKITFAIYYFYEYTMTNAQWIRGTLYENTIASYGNAILSRKITNYARVRQRGTVIYIYLYVVASIGVVKKNVGMGARIDRAQKASGREGSREMWWVILRRSTPSSEERAHTRGVHVGHRCSVPESLAYRIETKPFRARVIVAFERKPARQWRSLNSNTGTIITIRIQL